MERDEFIPEAHDRIRADDARDTVRGRASSSLVSIDTNFSTLITESSPSTPAAAALVLGREIRALFETRMTLLNQGLIVTPSRFFGSTSFRSNTSCSTVMCRRFWSIGDGIPSGRPPKNRTHSPCSLTPTPSAKCLLSQTQIVRYRSMKEMVDLGDPSFDRESQIVDDGPVRMLRVVEIDLVRGLALPLRTSAHVLDFTVDLRLCHAVDIRPHQQQLEGVDVGLLVVGDLEEHVTPCNESSVLPNAGGS
jgi:hypothetical protein